jgi:hypothetical protein
MGFYAKDEPARPAADKPVAGTLSRARKPRPENAIPPILTVVTGHRFYNPELGRWGSRGPMQEPAGANPQQFCQNDPLRRLDRLGLADMGSMPGDNVDDTGGESECPCDCEGCSVGSFVLIDLGSRGRQVNVGANIVFDRAI